jgi:hypothetical protein
MLEALMENEADRWMGSDWHMSSRIIAQIPKLATFHSSIPSHCSIIAAPQPFSQDTVLMTLAVPACLGFVRVNCGQANPETTMTQPIPDPNYRIERRCPRLT